MQEYFRFGLQAELPAERQSVEAESCWATVRRWEEQEGRPFGEIVHDLRLQFRPQEIPGRLGVSRHFLYTHFGWAMDKVAWVERQYGKPLGEVVIRLREEGATLHDLAQEWGLVVTTLYNALKHQRAGKDKPGAKKSPGRALRSVVAGEREHLGKDAVSTGDGMKM